VGYLGRLLSTFLLLGPVSAQALSGLHVFWLVVAVRTVRTKGSATFVAVLKGLVELSLSSHLGVIVLPVAVVQGVAVDLVSAGLGRSHLSACLAGGASSACSTIVYQALLFPLVSVPVQAAVFGLSFVSGAVLGGFLGQRVATAALQVLEANA